MHYGLQGDSIWGTLNLVPTAHSLVRTGSGGKMCVSHNKYMENFVIVSLSDTVKRKDTFLQLIKKIHGSGPDNTDKLNHTTTPLAHL